MSQSISYLYENEDINDLILSDDGTGQGIIIPALLINKLEGD